MFEHLSAIVYLSKEQEPFSEAQIKHLAKSSSQYNASHEISGYLYYKEGVFIQYLEGKQADINHLMQRIHHDKRHHIIKEIILGDINERHFMGWDMRYLSIHELSKVELEDSLDWIIQGLQDQFSETLTNDVRQLVDDLRSVKEHNLIS